MLSSTFGWSHSDILRLSIRQFSLYLRRIDRIDARRQLKELEAATFPHLKKRERDTLLRRYDVIARPPSLISDPRKVKESWEVLKTGKWRSKVPQ